MDPSDDQQFCLRWNNFQANITSQFETLRDDEDFIDVTIACEGQRLQAHKVVLSACSPFFKDLFKNNPCSHPIIFMRDVEASHIVALLEFMYAGEVNVAQAQLSGFLKTAESLKIRGLTETSSDLNQKDEDTFFLNEDPLLPKKNQNVACNSTVTSSQDIRLDKQVASSPPPSKKQCSQESELQLLQAQLEDAHLHRLTQGDDTLMTNAISLGETGDFDIDVNKSIQPKLENPDYLSDEDHDEPKNYFHNVTTSSVIGGMEIIPHLGSNKDATQDINIGTDSRKLHSLDPRQCEECGRVYSNLSNLRQHMKLIHYPTHVSCPFCTKPFKTDLYLRRHISSTHDSDYLTTNSLNLSTISSIPNLNNSYTGLNSRFLNKLPKGCEEHVSVSRKFTSPVRLRRRRLSENWATFDSCSQSGAISPDILSRLRNPKDKSEGDRKNRLVKLGEGIEIYEDQLRSVKWSDYRKLTRGLATILFSPAELATCSVTGQRWSRAGSGERPVKPALDKNKVQAIISYVATRFPMVEISRIKQVLAYKCKENSTAFKMKAVRYYGDQIRESDKN